MPRFDLGPTLAEAKADAAAEIDRRAEEARLAFLTPGSGQALEYQATEEEARRWLASGQEFDPEAYPFVEAERAAVALATGGQPPPPAAVAQAIVDQADGWKLAGSAIKALRRAAKMRVEAAATHAEIRAAKQVAWPVPG